MTSDLLEENQDLRKQVEELEKENAELKEFINTPHTKGRKTTRGDYIKTVWELSKKLAEAKELLKDITSSYGSTEVSEAQLYLKIKKAEQFLKECK